MRNSTIAKIFNLSQNLRKKGYDKYADELEFNSLILKKSQTNLYSVFKETGENLVDLAHPKGSHSIEGVQGDNVVETITDQKEKIEKSVKKEPTGKLAHSSLVNIIKMGGSPEITAMIEAGEEAAKKGLLKDTVNWFKSLPWKRIMQTAGIGVAASEAGHAIGNYWTDSVSKVDKSASITVESTLRTLTQLRAILASQPDLNLTMAIDETTQFLRTLSSNLNASTMDADSRRRVSEQLANVIKEINDGNTSFAELAARGAIPGVDTSTYQKINDMQRDARLMQRLQMLQSAFTVTSVVPPVVAGAGAGAEAGALPGSAADYDARFLQGKIKTLEGKIDADSEWENRKKELLETKPEKWSDADKRDAFKLIYRLNK
jgi:hypothetical protein